MYDQQKKTLHDFCRKGVDMEDALFLKYLMVRVPEKRTNSYDVQCGKKHVAHGLGALADDQFEIVVSQMKAQGSCASFVSPASISAPDHETSRENPCLAPSAVKKRKHGCAFEIESTKRKNLAPELFRKSPTWFEVPVYDEDAEEFFTSIELKREDFQNDLHERGGLFHGIVHEMPVLKERSKMERIAEAQLHDPAEDFWESVNVARLGQQSESTTEEKMHLHPAHYLKMRVPTPPNTPKPKIMNPATRRLQQSTLCKAGGDAGMTSLREKVIDAVIKRTKAFNILPTMSKGLPNMSKIKMSLGHAFKTLPSIK